MKLRRRKDETVPVTTFGYEIPAVEAERCWPATSFGGRQVSEERVEVSAPTRWGHDPIESTLPPVVSRPTSWIGTELDEEPE